MAAVEPLPLVPAMWTNFSFFSGLPILASSSWVRPRPGILPFQQTEWIYSMASLAVIVIASFLYFFLSGQMPMRWKIFALQSRYSTSTSSTRVMPN